MNSPRLFSAPAKLNLRLKVVGRRADGMHLLESEVVLLDLRDTVALAPRDDGDIRRAWKHPLVGDDDDLAVRAASALRAKMISRRGNGAGEKAGRVGADVSVVKQIPVGGGLGGASSDAATVLLALNRMWGADFSREELSAMAGELSADAPFFVSGEGRAEVRGIGETIMPYYSSRRSSGGTHDSDAPASADSTRRWSGGIPRPDAGASGRVNQPAAGAAESPVPPLERRDEDLEFYAIASPGVVASTAGVFAEYDRMRAGQNGRGELTSAAESAIIASLAEDNDLAAAACRLHPEIAQCAIALQAAAEEAGGSGDGVGVKMTGSGACVFVRAESLAAARRMCENSGAVWSRAVWALDTHPLGDFV